MSRIATVDDTRRFTRAAILGAVLGISVVLLIGLKFFLEDHLSPHTLWQARLIFLLVIGISYGLIALALALAIPVSSVLVYRARRRRQSCQIWARVLLLSVSLLLGLIVAEAIAGVQWGQSHRSTALPVGVLGETEWDGVHPKFPAPLENVQLPDTFVEEPKDGSIEIVVIGESSAAGVPYDWWLSVGDIVAWQLQKIIPGRRFHYTNLAYSGDTLEVQYRKLASLRRRPDLFLIYAGHNEFSARFPWSRQVEYYLDGHQPGLWDIVVQIAEGRSPICGMIQEELDKCHVALPPPPGGYRLLVDEPVYSHLEMQILVRDFERRLDAMVSYAERLRALPILIAPPANDFDYEPNRSSLPPETTRSQRAAFERAFRAAREHEQSDPQGSLAAYQSLLDRYPGFAELHYRTARLLARSARWKEAYRHSIAARALDGFPERCLPAFQDTYRRVAARHQCTLIDGQEYFHRIGYHGLLDDHLFHDALHPSLRGHIALAQAVLLAIHDRKAFGWPERVVPPVIDPAECAQHYRLTAWAWQKVCDFGIMFYMLTPGLRYDPTARQAKLVQFSSARERIQSGELPESVGMPNLGVPVAVPLVPEIVSIPARTDGVDADRIVHQARSLTAIPGSSPRSSAPELEYDSPDERASGPASPAPPGSESVDRGDPVPGG